MFQATEGEQKTLGCGVARSDGGTGAHEVCTEGQSVPSYHTDDTECMYRQRHSIYERKRKIRLATHYDATDYSSRA